MGLRLSTEQPGLHTVIWDVSSSFLSLLGLPPKLLPKHATLLPVLFFF